MSKIDVIQGIMKDFSVSEKEAREYVEMYWQNKFTQIREKVTISLHHTKFVQGAVGK